MSILSIDFETRSTVDLLKSGVYAYAEHPSTDVWCLAWAFDEEPEIWTPQTGHHDDMPTLCRHCENAVTGHECRGCGGGQWAHLDSRVVEHIQAGGEVRAWNAQFERIIWREIMVKRYGAPAIRDEQFVCSAAEAAAMALPRNLASAAYALGVEQKKDDAGHRLMMRMCRPRKVNPDGTLVWWDVEEKKLQLYAYCKQDVRTEKSIVKALRRLTPREREVYLLDQRINDRGIQIDIPLVEAASEVVAEGQRRANQRIAQLTEGAVSKITNNARLTDWLNESDVETEGVSKPAIAALLERDDLTANTREVLTLRAEAGRSSIAKLKSMLRAVCADSMVRGLLLYHAASTGRWAGKLVQPQNFPRGEVKRVEDYLQWILDRNYDALDMIAHPIVIVLSALRSMLTAREGFELTAGDYSAIEARVLNWLAGQNDVVEMFRMYDQAPKSEKPKYDPYRNMAVRMGRGSAPELVTPQDRQAGKAAELGAGFGMGWEKFISAAWTVYQVAVTEEQSKDAIRIYRDTHEKVVDFWYATERACMNATREPGSIHTFGGHRNLRATVRGGYLYVILPSGRPLCYAAPHIAERMTPWKELKESLHFKGVDPFTKQWGTQSTYGGALVENIVQAVARDLIAEAMLRVEVKGYLPVLSVHDEVVAEAPVGFGSVEEFERLMSELPTWAEGCPVAAEGWRGFRYRK